ncbi:MAG: thioredoxin family protein [Alphaproteobacteria bacterium]|nr:thioredoxin family protein [Alphaproteobacteria bacterium]
MVALETPEVQIGWNAADFDLPGTDGKRYRLQDVRGPNGLLVMFICNHCPFVKAIMDKIVRDAEELKQHGVHSVAIMSNDVDSYPDDSFDNMKKLAAARNFLFPYLLDETQAVARAYGAVCTPDFFGFDGALKLRYRGRLDDSRMEHKTSGERELFNAMLRIAETGKGPSKQLPSIGCSIKWKPGRAA